eukprot:scaffold808_cov194-Pinguiococcus_pyrenoidosus.AAC.1
MAERMLWGELGWATKRGDVEMVKTLLNQGANQKAVGWCGAPPLCIAAHNGHLAVVNVLLDRGADKEAATENGRTPLYMAAEKGHLEVVDVLLDQGASKEAPNKDGWTPLFIASQNGHLEVINALLDRGADKEAATKDGWTPLLTAAENNHLEVVDVLLDRGANTEAATKHGWTPLFTASHKHLPEVVNMLLDRGANKDAATEDGWTPLFVASQNGHLEVINALLDREADKEAATKDGWTPLLTAAYNGHLEVVNVLLDRGADKEATTDNGWTPLYMAAESGHLEVVKMLLDRVANKEAPNKDGWTPLFIASQNGHLEVVNALLGRGADKEAATKDGWTPLLTAAYNGHFEVVNVLLDRGADKEAATDNGWTPLLIAACNGHSDVVNVLLDQGADKEAAMKRGAAQLWMAAENGDLEMMDVPLDLGPNEEAIAQNGATPLYMAAQNGHSKMVKMLLDRGANTEAAAEEGWTPLVIAARNGHVEVVSVLLDRKANIEAATRNGDTPLLVAARNGHTRVVDVLFATGANLEAAARRFGEKLVFAAAELGHHELIGGLLDNGAKTEVMSRDGATPLYVAAQNGHLEVVNVLLGQGANAEAATRSGQSLEHSAALNDTSERASIPSFSDIDLVLGQFWELGWVWEGKPEAVAVSGQRPLHGAALNGHLEIVNVLLTQECNPEAENEDGETPLFLAAKNGHVEIVNVLLQQGCKPEVENDNGETPLLMAAGSGHLEVVNVLLAQGARATGIRHDGATALYVAAQNGHLEVVKMLWNQARKSEAAASEDATSSLIAAARNGHLEVVQELLRNGVNAEGTSKNGFTALHHAAEKGHVGVASLLLESGAGIDVENDDRDTPMALAAKEGQPDVVLLLMERQARFTIPSKQQSASLSPSFSTTRWTTPLHILVRHGADSLFKKTVERLLLPRSANEDVNLLQDSRLVELLLAKDGEGDVAVDLLEARLEKLPSLAAAFQVLCTPISRTLLERSPIPVVRIHLCGPGGSGKTLLRYQLLEDVDGVQSLTSKGIIETRTRSVNVCPATLTGVSEVEYEMHERTVSAQLFDHGGQQEFHVTYRKLLGQPLSIYIVVLPVCPNGIPLSDAEDETYILEPTTADTTERDLRHWLSMLSTLAHSVAHQVVVAVNVFEGTDSTNVDRHVRAVRNVLREYVSWAGVVRDEEGDAKNPKESMHPSRMLTQLQLVEKEPVVLNCMSSSEWKEASDQGGGSLFAHVCRAWDALQAMERTHGVEVTMPKLCSDLITNIPKLRDSQQKVEIASDAREVVKKTIRGVYESLTKGAINSLFTYAERCGEVLLVSSEVGSEKRRESATAPMSEGLVIWDPGWFFSKVLGELFQPSIWNRDGGRPVNMNRSDVKHILLRTPMSDVTCEIKDPARVDCILDIILGLLHDIQLCAVVHVEEQPSEEDEVWFPLFLNSPDYELFPDTNIRAPKRRKLSDHAIDHCSPKKTLCNTFRILAEGDWKNGRYHGHLMSIRDLRAGTSRSRSDSSKIDWRIVLPGSFERFMARVFQAYHPGSVGGPRVSMAPNLVQVQWKSSARHDRRCAHVQCQMLFDEKHLKIACMIWVWTSNNDAASHLLEDQHMNVNSRSGESQRLDPTLQVVGQFASWMKEASSDETSKLQWNEYTLEDDAFLATGKEILQLSNNFLAYEGMELMDLDHSRDEEATSLGEHGSDLVLNSAKVADLWKRLQSFEAQLGCIRDEIQCQNGATEEKKSSTQGDRIHDSVLEPLAYCEDDFEDQIEIGRGGFGMVYRAKHR